MQSSRRSAPSLSKSMHSDHETHTPAQAASQDPSPPRTKPQQKMVWHPCALSGGGRLALPRPTLTAARISEPDDRPRGHGASVGEGADDDDVRCIHVCRVAEEQIASLKARNSELEGQVTQMSQALVETESASIEFEMLYQSEEQDGAADRRYIVLLAAEIERLGGVVPDRPRPETPSEQSDGSQNWYDPAFAHLGPWNPTDGYAGPVSGDEGVPGESAAVQGAGGETQEGGSDLWRP